MLRDPDIHFHALLGYQIKISNLFLRESGDCFALTESMCKFH